MVGARFIGGTARRWWLLFGAALAISLAVQHPSAAASASVTEQWNGTLENHADLSFKVEGHNNRKGKFVADDVTHIVAKAVPMTCTYNGHSNSGVATFEMVSETGRWTVLDVSRDPRFDGWFSWHVVNDVYGMGIGGHLLNRKGDETHINPTKSRGSVDLEYFVHANGYTCKVDGTDQLNNLGYQAHLVPDN